MGTEVMVWEGVGGCERVWEDVRGCGRVWEGVEGCGREWEGVEGLGRSGREWKGVGRMYEYDENTVCKEDGSSSWGEPEQAAHADNIAICLYSQNILITITVMNGPYLKGLQHL